MIEALAPANRVSASASPLLERLLADGLVRPRLMMTAEGAPVEATGLDVSPHPYRPLAANGSVTAGLYVLGLQLSASQWGTAIAAEAFQPGGPAYPSGQRTLRDADEIARAILGSDRLHAGNVHPCRRWAPLPTCQSARKKFFAAQARQPTAPGVSPAVAGSPENVITASAAVAGYRRQGTFFTPHSVPLRQMSPC